MTIRLHLGGSKHGQLLDVPGRHDVVEYAVVVHREVRYEPEWINPLDVVYTKEMYRQEQIGLFGRRLYVMVLMSGDRASIDDLGFEFLASSLAKILVEDG
jgi:hypothetical protein